MLSLHLSHVLTLVEEDIYLFKLKCAYFFKQNKICRILVQFIMHKRLFSIFVIIVAYNVF